MRNIKKINALPDNQKYVYLTIRDFGTQTFGDIVRRTKSLRLAEKSIRYILMNLEKQDLIITKFNFRDARSKLYLVKPEPKDDA